MWLRAGDSRPQPHQAYVDSACLKSSYTRARGRVACCSISRLSNSGPQMAGSCWFSWHLRCARGVRYVPIFVGNPRVRCQAELSLFFLSGTPVADSSYQSVCQRAVPGSRGRTMATKKHLVNTYCKSIFASIAIVFSQS